MIYRKEFENTDVWTPQHTVEVSNLLNLRLRLGSGIQNHICQGDSIFLFSFLERMRGSDEVKAEVSAEGKKANNSLG